MRYPAENGCQAARVCTKAGRAMRLPACGSPTVPGVITSRACPYYGARWLLAPVKETLHLVHGPVGCAYYGQTVRRKSYRILSTALDEKDVVFGGDTKLVRAVREALRLFPDARAVFVYGCCVAGLTGADLAGICRLATRATGRTVVPVSCAGFGGASQGDGHDLAADVLVRFLVGRTSPAAPASYTVNLLGEFDVAGDLQEIKMLLNQLGVSVLCTFTGEASVTSLGYAHAAALNLVHCQRTGGSLAEAMTKVFGTPALKVNFFGFAATAASLRAVAAHFGREEAAEQIIRAAETRVEPVLAELRRHLAGRRVGLYFGGSRVGSMAAAYRELGMEVVWAGAQFGQQEDYAAAWPDVADGGVLLDDARQFEIEKFLCQAQPDLFVGGVRERFLAYKYGVPFTVFPQEGKPYAGFTGFINFAQDIWRAVASPVWRLVHSQ